MKKNAFIRIFLLIFTLLFSVVSCAKFLNNAYDLEEDLNLSFNDDFYTYKYEFDTKKLIISLNEGESFSTDFVIPAQIKKNTIFEVVLDDRIERLPDNAFAGIKTLRKFNFPQNLNSVGENIIQENLKQLHLNYSNLENQDLVDVSLFDSVINFSYVKNDTLFVRYETGIPDYNSDDEFNNTVVHSDCTFKNKPVWNGVTVSKLVILPGTTGIGSYAFSNYFVTGLRSIEIGEGIKRLQKRCFLGQTDVSQISIPDSLYNAFMDAEAKNEVMTEGPFFGWQDDQSIKVNFSAEDYDENSSVFIKKLTEFNNSKLLFSDNAELPEGEYSYWSSLYIDDNTGSCECHTDKSWFFIDLNSANKKEGGTLSFDDKITSISFVDGDAKMLEFENVILPSNLTFLIGLNGISCPNVLEIPETVINISMGAFSRSSFPVIMLNWSSQDAERHNINGLLEEDILNKTEIYYNDGVRCPILEDNNRTFSMDNISASIIDDHILEINVQSDSYRYYLDSLLSQTRKTIRINDDGKYEVYEYTIKSYCDYDTVILKGKCEEFNLSNLDVRGKNISIDIQAEIDRLYLSYANFTELKLSENVKRISGELSSKNEGAKVLLSWNKEDLTYRAGRILSQASENDIIVCYADGSYLKSEDFIGIEYTYESVSARIIDNKTLEVIGNESLSNFHEYLDSLVYNNELNYGEWETVVYKGSFSSLNVWMLSSSITKIVIDADVNIASLGFFKELHINGKINEFVRPYYEGVVYAKKGSSIYLNYNIDTATDPIKILAWDAYAIDVNVYFNDGTLWEPSLTPEWVNEQAFIYKYKGFTARLLGENSTLVIEADGGTSSDLYDFLHYIQNSDFGNGYTQAFPVILSEISNLNEIIITGKMDYLALNNFDFPFNRLIINAQIDTLNVDNAKFSHLEINESVAAIEGNFAENQGSVIWLNCYSNRENIPDNIIPALEDAANNGILIYTGNGTRFDLAYGDSFYYGSASARIYGKNLEIQLDSGESSDLNNLLHSNFLKNSPMGEYKTYPFTLADYTTYNEIIVYGNEDVETLDLYSFDFTTERNSIRIHAPVKTLFAGNAVFEYLYLPETVTNIEGDFGTGSNLCICLPWSAENIPEELFACVSRAYFNGINAVYNNGLTIDTCATTIGIEGTDIYVNELSNGTAELVIKGDCIEYDLLCKLLNMKRFKTENMHGYTYADGIYFSKIIIDGNMNELRLPAYSCFTEVGVDITYGDDAYISTIGDIPFMVDYLYIPESVRSINCNFEHFSVMSMIKLGWDINDTTERDLDNLYLAKERGVLVKYSDGTDWN